MSDKQSSYCGLPAAPASLPIWRELFFPAEWLGLVISPVYRGGGVARGNREPVVLVPGFLASDLSLQEMHLWLERIGYDPHAGGIGIYLDCPDMELAKLVEQIEKVSRETGQAVRLVAHSLGGTLARAAAARRPELVAQVITLGSPIHELRIHRFVIRLSRAVESITPSPEDVPRAHNGHFHSGSCSCELWDAMTQHLPAEMPHASIYSKTDGIVDWRSSVDDPPGVNREVQASHIGLLVNAQAYKAIAELLASVKTPARNGATEQPSRVSTERRKSAPATA